MVKKIIFCLLLISSQMVSNDAFEENNSFATAKELSLGNHNTLVITLGDEDWYKINLTPGQFYIKMETGAIQNPLYDLNLVLQNSNNQDIAANITSNTIEEIKYHVVTSGTYYIRVFPASSGGANNYSLSLSKELTFSGDDSYEPNDTFNSSSQISNYNNVITNLKAYDEDWFSFVSPPGTFTVEVTYDNTQEELSLEAYDSNKNRLNNATGSNGKVTIEVDRAHKETITLAVLGTKGTTYSLKIKHPVKWMKEISTAGPISASSPVSFDIDNDGKNEIIIGTRPYLDNQGNEVRPAKLICLEDDGTVKWEKTFPAITGTDPVTGKTYSSSSISSRPLISDINNNGKYEIIVAVGVDLDYILPGTSSDVYSPGHKGGVYAIDALTADTLWFRESKDTIGGSNNSGDDLPDGVYSSPIACDLNNDGNKEVIWGSWDQHVYVVNGSDGSNFAANAGSKWPVNQHDTIWSSPICADINNDGLLEILIGGDITENEEALTKTGGIFHVYDRWGREIIDGFKDYIKFDDSSNDFSFMKGKYEEQTIWSTPTVGDLDKDGKLEIAYGTGLYIDNDPIGNYVKIWKNDGREYLKLTTNGRVFAQPIFADINNDNTLEIIAVTVNGWVHAWTNMGTSIFATKTYPSGATGGTNHPIYSNPLAVDTNKDGNLEIIYQQGVSLTVVSHNGIQLTNSSKWGLKNEYFRGTPSISDLDDDGNIEIVTGGTNEARNSAVVYAFNYGTENNALDGFKYANKEFNNSGVYDISDAQINRKNQISAFVTRFYEKVLNRTPDSWGLSDWTSRLMEGDKSGADVAKGFILSQEFINQNKTNDDYLNVLYAAFFNRNADSAGFNDWKSKLESGSHSREDVLNGFLGAQEFINLSNTYNISPQFTATQGLNRVLVSEFVTRMYNQVLKRTPDNAGLDDWTNQLMQKTRTGSTLAEGFIFSQEFLNRGLNNEEYVKVLYRAFFGRSADTGGLNGWVQALNSNEFDRARVLGGFTQSQEFINLTNSYGIIAY